MSITPKQEKFAQEVANGKTQADAYRAAYSCEASKPETVQKRASELMADGAVKGRVEELREKLTNKALWTREMSVIALTSALANAEKPTDTVAVVKELNAMHGFNAPTQLNVTTRELPSSIDEFI